MASPNLSRRTTTAAHNTRRPSAMPTPQVQVVENPFDALLESEHVWSNRDIGTNSISGFMNDTAVSSFLSGPKLMRPADNVPIVPPAQIRRVKISEHDAYIKHLSDVIDKYQLNRALGGVATEGIPLLGESNDSLESSLKDRIEEYGNKIMGKGPNSAASRLERYQQTRILTANAPPLETVPLVFMDKNFDLTNPNTFSAVYEYLDITGVNTTDVSTMNRELQDKLTHCLDTVEVHLLKEISRRSMSFFSALAHLQALHTETDACVKKIADIRNKLSTVAAKTAQKGLEIVRMKKRRGNLMMLYGAVKLVSDVKQSQPMIQVLMGQADYVGVLELIENTMLILKGMDPMLTKPESFAAIALSNITPSGTQNNQDRPIEEKLTDGILLIRHRSIVPRNLDLRGVRSVVHLNGQLAEMSRTISLVMETEFVNLLISDVKEHLILMIQESISPSSRLSVSQSSSPRYQSLPVMPYIRNIITSQSSPVSSSPTIPVEIPSETLAFEEKLRGRLTPLILGLIRMDKFPSAIQAYKTALMKVVKDMSRKLYPSVESPATPSSFTTIDSKSNDSKKDSQLALAKQLRALSFDAFYKLLLDVYVCLLNIIQRVAVQRELMIGVIRNAQSQGLLIGMECLKSLPKEVSSATSPSRRMTLDGRKRLLDDDDDLGSFAELNDATDPTNLLKSKSRGDLSGDAAASIAKEIMGSDVALNSVGTTFQQMLLDASDPLFSAADLSHVRCSKLIVVRSDQNAQLNAKDFYRLFRSTWEFVVAGETLCGRICLGLKGSIMSQSKNYMNHFHDERSKQVAAMVENEQWAQAEVPVEFQALTDALVQGGNPKSDVIKEEVFTPDLEDEPALDDEGEMDLGSVKTGRPPVPTTENRPSETLDQHAIKTMRSLTIDGSKYYTVSAVLVFLKSLGDYIECADSLSALAMDVMNRVLELLKLFNSRVCQMILGAGALQSAGLKNITARHIALASQSLSIVIAIIPFLRATFNRILPTKQQSLTSDFDKIQRDYQDHQNELHLKLVNIMVERLTLYGAKLTNLAWENPDMKEFSPEGVTIHMQALVKETVTLHKVLAKYLPAESLRSIILEIFRNYNQLLESCFKKIDFYTSAAKNRLMIDVQFFIQDLSALDGVDGPGSHLEIIVNNIKIKDKRAVVAPSPVPVSKPAPPPPNNPFNSSKFTFGAKKQ